MRGGVGPESEPPVKPFEGDWKATVKAAVDLTPRELLTHLSRYHDPGFLHLLPA
jgi:hypothetical protein